jgi:capsid protein
MISLRAIRLSLAKLIAPRARYEAAQWSTRRSQLPGAGLQSARFDASNASLYQLRAKSRYFEKNCAIVNKLADLWEQYTVGSGLVVQPASSDAAWNEAAAEWWAYWTELPDISSRQSLGSLLAMGARGWFIDGEQFILQVKGESGMPRLQFIEAHLVSTPPDLASDPNVLDGVRVDPKTLRPLSYYIASQPTKTTQSTWTEVPAQYVIPIWEPSRPGQLRGIPLLHAALNTLHDLDDLRILEMGAAKDAAKISKVIKTTPEEFNPATLQAVRVTQSIPTSTGGTMTVDRAAYYDSVLGEDKVILRPGDEYNQFATARPSVVTRDYWRYLDEQVCAAVGIPYVLVYPDSMQGTVYRGAIDSAASFFELRSAVMQAVVARIYQYAMGWARYTQPTLVDAPADWKNIRVSPPRAVNVDVGRNSKAMLEEIAGGASTFDRSYAALGLDYRQELRQRAEEAAYIKELAEEYGLDTSEISVLLKERTQATAEPTATVTANPDETDGETTRDDEETANANA